MSNWIKLRTGLINHPKVIRMAFSLFPLDQHRLSVIIGAIVQTWSMADMHADGEKLPGMSVEALDMLVGINGFARAMISIGWLKEEEDSLSLPNYQEHNGPNAKNRAMDQKLKRRNREDGVQKNGSCPDDVRILSGSCPDSIRTVSGPEREKEKEEEKNTKKTKDTPPPLKAVRKKFDPEAAELPFGSDEFARAWVGWCRHRGEIKKPLTPQATTEQIAKLSAMGEDRAIAALRHSIAGGWQGLFEPDGYRGGGLFAKPTALEKARESADLLAAGKSSIANSIVARLQQIDAEKEARNGVA